jgi:hypothetical protein
MFPVARLRLPVKRAPVTKFSEWPSAFQRMAIFLGKLPLRKKLFLASFLHFKEDLENQIVNYERSKTKSSH